MKTSLTPYGLAVLALRAGLTPAARRALFQRHRPADRDALTGLARHFASYSVAPSAKNPPPPIPMKK